MDGLTAIRELRRMEATGEMPRRYPVIAVTGKFPPQFPHEDPAILTGFYCCQATLVKGRSMNVYRPASTTCVPILSPRSRDTDTLSQTAIKPYTFSTLLRQIRSHTTSGSIPAASSSATLPSPSS